MLVKGYVKLSSSRALHPALPDVLGYSDHRMPDIIAGAKRPCPSSKLRLTQSNSGPICIDPTSLTPGICFYQWGFAFLGLQWRN